MFAKSAYAASNLCLKQLRYQSYHTIKQLTILNRSVTTKNILPAKPSLLSNRKNVCFYSTKPPIQIAKYEEVKDLPNHPEKLLIDVREPAELKEFGVIPTSINIPLGNVNQELSSTVRDDVFKTKYGREKPKPNTEIIFHCRIGKRSGMAAETAIGLGYTNVKNYEGSWIDWAEHEGLPK